MSEWLLTLWRIALLRAGPQDVPAGRASLMLALIAYVAVVLVSGLADERGSEAVDLLVAVALPLALAAALLASQGKTARFQQTAAALFGTGALISLVNAPLWFTNTTPVPTPLVVLALIGLVWSLAVDGHIWRHALETTYAGGVSIAVVILIVQLFAFQALSGS